MLTPGLGTSPEKAKHSCSKFNCRRDLLQNPIGTLVGTSAITAKCQDVSFTENLGMGARRVLISPSIQCRASHCTINADVCHEVPLLGCGCDPRTSGSGSLEPRREGNRSKVLTWTAQLRSMSDMGIFRQPTLGLYFVHEQGTHLF